MLYVPSFKHVSLEFQRRKPAENHGLASETSTVNVADDLWLGLDRTEEIELGNSSRQSLLHGESISVKFSQDGSIARISWFAEIALWVDQATGCSLWGGREPRG